MDPDGGAVPVPDRDERRLIHIVYEHTTAERASLRGRQEPLELALTESLPQPTRHENRLPRVGDTTAGELVDRCCERLRARVELRARHRESAWLHHDRRPATRGRDRIECFAGQREAEGVSHRWRDFVAWGSTFPGSGTFRLVRDADDSATFMSFAPWESFEAQAAWKESPEFPERIGRVRRHTDAFAPSVFELVTTVE